MKKFAKLSLVTAVALAGLTSTVSAKDLTEAIKGVDISGQVRYRIQEDSKSGTEAEGQDVDIDVVLKVPVTDKINFIAHAVFDNGNVEGNTTNTTKNQLDEYFFQYVNGPVTSHLGTHEIAGRLTDGAVGQGLTALYDAGVATVGAVAMYDNDISAEALYSVIAYGNAGPVSFLGQYVDVENVTSAYNLKVDASVDMIKAGVEYSAKDNDGTNNDDLETLKAYVSAKAGIVSATATYASTGKDGSGSIDGSATVTETPAEYLLWNLGSAGKSELDLFAIDATVTLTDKISVRAAYAGGEHGAGNTEISETLGQINYKVASNLNTYLRYSILDEEGQADRTRGRLEVKYSF